MVTHHSKVVTQHAEMVTQHAEMVTDPSLIAMAREGLLVFVAVLLVGVVGATSHCLYRYPECVKLIPEGGCNLLCPAGSSRLWTSYADGYVTSYTDGYENHYLTGTNYFFLCIAS